MIDLHTHILPGVDDGAPTLAESLELANALLADGVRLAAATPHVSEDHPTSAARMHTLVVELRTALEAASMPLEIRTGGEVSLERLPELDASELLSLGLAGNPGYLLVEFPYYRWPMELPERIRELRLLGITPVLAHPERNPAVQAQPERLREAVESGALVQVTAASIDGRLGDDARRAGRRLVGDRLAHLIASDAHRPGRRAGAMRQAAAAFGGELGRWLTEGVPGAIAADQPLPERPPAGRRFRLGRRR